MRVSIAAKGLELEEGTRLLIAVRVQAPKGTRQLEILAVR